MLNFAVFLTCRNLGHAEICMSDSWFMDTQFGFKYNMHKSGLNAKLLIVGTKFKSLPWKTTAVV